MMAAHESTVYTPPDCWVLLQWYDHGGVSVVGVYPTFEYARFAKGDSLDSRLAIMIAPFYELQGVAEFNKPPSGEAVQARGEKVSR